jgi:hypothetical protein
MSISVSNALRQQEGRKEWRGGIIRENKENKRKRNKRKRKNKHR